jgi:hypothetical protein
VVNPIFSSPRYRRDLPEGRDLERDVRLRFEVDEARTIASAAKLDVTQLNQNWPGATLWTTIFDQASRVGALSDLLDAIENALEPAPKDGQVRVALQRVRNIALPGGSLSPAKLLLRGDRPFLGRTTLRGALTELQNWDSSAAILVVRGAEDSGRSETQYLLGDGNGDELVYVDEDLPLASTMRYIWKKAGASGSAPTLDQSLLTTESATFIDFWNDVKVALDEQDKRMWILFDDLDKGPGRVGVRALAEVLATRIRDVTFQRRFRLAILGYPDETLPAKVAAAFVRNDQTEDLNDVHVRAFLDYCMKAAGKNFEEAWVTSKATELCAQAKANVNAETPYLAALNERLKVWYRTL